MRGNLFTLHRSTGEQLDIFEINIDNESIITIIFHGLKDSVKGDPIMYHYEIYKPGAAPEVRIWYKYDNRLD